MARGVLAERQLGGRILVVRAVHRDRAGEDDARDTGEPCRLERIDSAQHIDPRGPLGLGIADGAEDERQVHDGLDLFRPDHGDHLAERLHVAPHEPEPLAVTAERGDARLGQGHVEEHHALAPAQKLIGERGADEPCAPRDEGRHGPTVTVTFPVEARQLLVSTLSITCPASSAQASRK